MTNIPFVFILSLLATFGTPMEESVPHIRSTRLSSAGRSQSSAFTNPILHSDFSDPDVICVDGEYWMTSSSFNCVPGLLIQHSTDLVNWETVGSALPDGLSEWFDAPRHGCGVWAPSIRHFNGKYWIFWGDPDFGVFQVHADHPAGEWSKPVQIWKGKGVIDTCPLCDDDGRMYLVHAWAGSRAGFKSVLGVCEMDAECTRFTSMQVLVYDGKKTGDDTIEGPKFYKRDGWYYIFAPSGGVKEGWQTMLRSKNVYGPYERRIVLHQGSTDIHGPHQGGWVEDAAGNSWFMHFEDRYEYGRVVHLQPMQWTSDGWCTMGKDIDGDGTGEPVYECACPEPYPAVEQYPRAVSSLSTATDFTHPYIPYNWQWHANPQPDWALPCPSEGYLRLNCIQNSPGWKNLWDTPNLLLEKVAGKSMELSAKLVFRPSYEGDRAGLVMMGTDYSTVEMVYEGGLVTLRRATCLGADEGSAEMYSDMKTLSADAPLKDSSTGCSNAAFYTLYLKVSVREGGLCSFSCSADGISYKPLGDDFKMKAGKWIGAKAGFFATSLIRRNDGGSVDVF